MKIKIKNPLAEMFRALSKVLESAQEDTAQQERAVNISAVWAAVQNHLNETGTPSEDGETRYSGYVLDVYLEDTGVFAIITRNDGKLYKVPVTVDADSQVSLGEEQLVVMDFKPVTARSLTVKRQADGRVRWFAMPACTAVLNRVGEIDSRALFDSFVEHIERDGGAYPELDFFHLGERLVLGTADWVGRDGYSYCASGLFDETEIGRAAAEALEKDPDYWGLSIAYLPTKDAEKLCSSEGIEIPVYTAGINRYISLLPENTAASILTSISTKEEVNRMEKHIKNALRKLVGNDDKLFNSIVEAVDDVNRSATGMINREQPQAQTPAAAPAAAAPATVVREISDADLEAIFASEKFATLFDAKLNAAIEARSAKDPTEESEEEPEGEETPAAAAEPVADESLRTVLVEVKKLTDKVEELSKARAAEEEIQNDMPVRMKRTEIVRPRATRMPAEVNERQVRTTNMAEIANQTLANMGEPA